jgi:hypothetical protein
MWCLDAFIAVLSSCPLLHWCNTLCSVLYRFVAGSQPMPLHYSACTDWWMWAGAGMGWVLHVQVQELGDNMPLVAMLH